MVSVVGATGGVGATTFAALLARDRTRAGQVTLVDLGGGAGVDVLLGIERAPGARWSALAGLRGTLEPDALDGLLPRWGRVEVLSADRCGPDPGAQAVRAVLDALRAQGRAVVVDLASAALGSEVGDAVAEHVGSGRGELVLLAGQDVLGAAGAVAARARHHGPAHLVLRRRRSGVAPLEAAHVVDLPLLGLLPSDRRIADAVERGLGPQPGRRLRRAVARIGGRLGTGRTA
jgi:hypothetical protein